jgi:hypothetical protein
VVKADEAAGRSTAAVVTAAGKLVDGAATEEAEIRVHSEEKLGDVSGENNDA